MVLELHEKEMEELKLSEQNARKNLSDNGIYLGTCATE